MCARACDPLDPFVANSSGDGSRSLLRQCSASEPGILKDTPELRVNSANVEITSETPVVVQRRSIVIFVVFDMCRRRKK